jgi:hypothetical protein
MWQSMVSYAMSTPSEESKHKISGPGGSLEYSVSYW